MGKQIKSKTRKTQARMSNKEKENGSTDELDIKEVLIGKIKAE